MRDQESGDRPPPAVAVPAGFDGYGDILAGPGPVGAEVAVRLNQAQFAYDASAGVFNVIRNMSLLNVLK